MTKYKITITPLSYLAPASGTNGPLIDIDVLYDLDTGLPYLNGKRIKGLLRESAREVLEIEGKNDTYIESWINKYFGVSDSRGSQAKINHAGNFYLKDSDDVNHFLKHTSEEAYSSDRVLSLFTSEKTVTAVDDDGIAKDKSLRVYRLIKPSTENIEIIFEGYFDINFDEGDEKIFMKACKNLRFMGTSRNVGLGKIKVKCNKITDDGSENTNRNDDSTIVKKNCFSISETEGIKVSLTTISPIVISKATGDPNTMNSGDSIDGSSIRGMLAYQYIKAANLTAKEAHQKDKFREIFLSGKVIFGKLNIAGAHRIPYHIQRYKAYKSENQSEQTSRVFKDVFAATQNDQVAKTYGKRGVMSSGGYHEVRVKKQMSFHNSRLERGAGKSTEDHPGIYYYESISAGQTFEGNISGDSTLINHLIQTIGTKLEAKLGKSKSVQYGHVSLELSKDDKSSDTLQIEADKYYLLKVLSPMIFENEYGIAIPSIDLFNNALDFDAKVINASCRTVPVEYYNTMWSGRSAKALAYDEGSVFLITVTESSKQSSMCIGAMTDLGYGRISLEPYDEGDLSKYENITVGTKDVMMEKPASNSILSRLEESFKIEELDNEIHLMALENVHMVKNLTRNQISRLSSLLKASVNLTVWQSFFEVRAGRNGLSNQEIGKKMKKLFIHEEIKGLQIPKSLKNRLSTQNLNFRNERKYFLYLFAAALKNSK